MANTYPNYQTTAGALPDIDTAVTGQDIAAEYWADVAGLVNHCHARQTWRIGQSWGAGVCRLGDADGQMVYGWRVPLVSQLHTTLTCYAYARSVSGSCSLTWTTSAGATATVAVGALGWYSVSLALPAAGTYTDVWFGASAMAAGDELEVLDVALYPAVLSSPLSATTAPTLPYGVGRYTPHGIAAIAGDRPLDSLTLRAMRDDIASLMERPRILYSWTGLTSAVQAWTFNALVGGNVSSTVMQDRPHHQLPRLQHWRDPRRQTCQVWAQVQRGAAAEVVVEGDGAQLVIPVAAGALALVWVSGVLDLAFARKDISSMGAAHVSRLGLYPTAGGGARPRTTAPVKSITIWGA